MSRVHRQPNRIYSVKGTHPTLPSQETSGRFFIYLPEQKKVRKLTISECYRIMGFPENFQKSTSISAQYKQIGNSVCIPMIEEIARQIKKQGLIMPNFYNFCEQAKHINNLDLQKIKNKISTSNMMSYCNEIIDNMYSYKGVYTVLITLLFYKHLNPDQDIRLHQSTLKNGNKSGFSGRSFDTHYITPVLKQLDLPSMGESGWLTRSLEQNLPYDLNYPGKINKKSLKNAFLQILDFIEEKEDISLDILYYIINQSFLKRNKNFITITKLKTSETININVIIDCLERHFYYRYETSGAAKLPMIAFHSIYQILIKEITKFSNCYIPNIGSYTASDRTSKTAGDLEVFYNNNKLKEAIEIKLGIPINSHIVRRAKEKIFKFNPERYYILSTSSIDTNDLDCINEEISFIKQQHGCQLILNGVIPTLKYYLRLINNTNDFIEKYSELIECDNELKFVHKEYWSNIISNLNSNL